MKYHIRKNDKETRRKNLDSNVEIVVRIDERLLENNTLNEKTLRVLAASISSRLSPETDHYTIYAKPLNQVVHIKRDRSIEDKHVFTVYHVGGNVYYNTGMLTWDMDDLMVKNPFDLNTELKSLLKMFHLSKNNTELHDEILFFLLRYQVSLLCEKEDELLILSINEYMESNDKSNYHVVELFQDEELALNKLNRKSE